MTACSLPPFRYQSIPQPTGNEGSSSNNINEQFLEAYLKRLKDAVCADLNALSSRLDSLEARIEALEP